MSTHNICICQEIRKILCGYPLLSVAMSDIAFYAVYSESSLFDQACLFGKYSRA